mmetsp:Transcript_34406/g.79634  ORF Transcript_34406/g.79634 Transcript_34406/m.79634 type:complete len:226 (-) Transcript_34406:1954-2631(-)
MDAGARGLSGLGRRPQLSARVGARRGRGAAPGRRGRNWVAESSRARPAQARHPRGGGLRRDGRGAYRVPPDLQVRPQHRRIRFVSQAARALLDRSDPLQARRRRRCARVPLCPSASDERPPACVRRLSHGRRRGGCAIGCACRRRSAQGGPGHRPDELRGMRGHVRGACSRACGQACGGWYRVWHGPARKLLSCIVNFHVLAAPWFYEKRGAAMRREKLQSQRRS